MHACLQTVCEFLQKLPDELNLLILLRYLQAFCLPLAVVRRLENNSPVLLIIEKSGDHDFRLNVHYSVHSSALLCILVVRSPRLRIHFHLIYFVF